MKRFILFIVSTCICLASFVTAFAQQEDVFYSIRKNDSYLVAIDTFGTVTPIGPLGVSVTSYTSISLDFDRCGNLYGIINGNLYTFNTTSGLATKVDTLSGLPNGQFLHSLSFNGSNEAFLMNEIVGQPWGHLYRLNANTAAAQLINSSTNAEEITAIEFDGTGNLWASETRNDVMFKLSTTTGYVVTAGYALNTAPERVKDLDFMINSNQMWVLSDEITEMHVRLVDFTDGTSLLKFALPGTYYGLASFSNTTLPAVPTITVTGSSTLCPTETVTLTSSSATNYVWSDGATTQSIVVSNAGNYFLNTSDLYGCTSKNSDTIIVTQSLITTQSIVHSICAGNSFEGYTNTGVYIDTFIGANGCDSIRTLNLTVLSNIRDTINKNICTGSSFEGYSVTGIHIDTFSAANSCDSIRVLNLTVNPFISSTVFDTICNGQFIEGYGQSGIYLDTFAVSGGCDSIRTLNLLVVTPTKPTITKAGSTLSVPDAFQSYQWYADGAPLNNANSYTFSVQSNASYYVSVENANGCTTTSDTLSVNISGVNEISANLIKVYPNPAKGKVLVEVPLEGQNKIQLFNINGSDMAIDVQKNGAEYSFTVSTFPPGIYVLRVSNQTASVSIKLFVL